MRRSIRLSLVIGSAFAALALAACADSKPGGGITPTYDKKTGKLTQLAYDSHHDGRIDTWTDMDGSKPLRSRIDRDGDGKIDRWEEYDASGALARVGFSRANNGTPDAWAVAAPDGGLQRIEISSTGDAHRIDRWEYYDPAHAGAGNRALVRAAEDTVGDGRPHKWETYRDGTIETVAFDENGDGIPDRRLTYRDSRLVLIESAPDAHGQFTIRTEVK
jgi:hypothetical protein